MRCLARLWVVGSALCVAVGWSNGEPQLRAGHDDFWTVSWGTDDQADGKGEHFHAWGDVQIRPVTLTDVFLRENVPHFTLEACYGRVRYSKTMDLSRRLGEVFSLEGKKLASFSEWERSVGKSFLVLYCSRCMTLLRAVEISGESNPYKCRG